MRCVLLVQREKSRWAWLIVWYHSVPVLLGRFLPQLLLWFVWEDGLFCKRGFGLNITSKETHLPRFRPPLTSLQRAELLSLLGVRHSARCSCTIWRIFHISSGLFCPGVFTYVSINNRQASARGESAPVWKGWEGNNRFPAVGTVLFSLTY